MLDDDKVSIHRVSLKYEEFVRLLRVNSIQFARCGGCTALHSETGGRGRVRRPFQAQALATIRPSLPRLDGMALNNVHYTVEVEGSAHLSSVRWTVAENLNEQVVRPARQTERVLPPAGQQGLRIPQRFGVHQLGTKCAHSGSSSEAGMLVHSSSPATSALTLRV